MYECFRDQVAVITGAAQGIGYAIAKAFIREGIDAVVLLDWNHEQVEQAAQQLAADTNATVLGMRCDVSDYDMVRKVMEEVETRFGKIDILVNNAAITRDAMFHKMTPNQWHSVVNVNLHGVFNCCHSVINGMRNRNYGRIVNISSTSAYGNVGQTNYAATKAALFGFTKSLARESARKGITCNCIEPDFINTAMMKSIPEDMLASRIKAAPMQRMGDPDELAAAVLFLASREASYVTGVALDVTGAIRT